MFGPFGFANAGPNPPRRPVISDHAIFSVLDSLERTTGRNWDLSFSSVSVSQAEVTSASARPSTNSSIWAKGTGPTSTSTRLGLGSDEFTSYGNWNAEAVQKERQKKEKTIISLLGKVVNFIDSRGQGSFPPEVIALLESSCLMPLLSDYLRNDSVLDISAHVPLYRVILQLLRSIASVPQLRTLLVPGGADSNSSIAKLLVKIKNSVMDYSKLLEASKADDVGMGELIPEIEATATQVQGAIRGFLTRYEYDNDYDASSQVVEDLAAAVGRMSTSTISPEERYVGEMKKLQFAFMEMIADGQVFKVPYHYEKDARMNWLNTPQRGKRLAQELLSLSTSLPLSYGSSIFLRYDQDRLDIIKVLITGPAGTPYSNGLFEFDIHFPFDYPLYPPKVNFETTGRGRHRIRFNPNLLADGSVCLSILSTETWQGASAEELWNPKTSTLLSVLVAIQSMIFVQEPYWNDGVNVVIDGGTEKGKMMAREYNAKIRSFTMYYAILEQMRNPLECFKEVIHRHWWIKRDEILAQCEQWMEFEEVFKPDLLQETVNEIKDKLLNMTPPPPLPEGQENLLFDKQRDSKGEKVGPLFQSRTLFHF